MRPDSSADFATEHVEPDLCAVATTVHGGADATADDVAAIDGRAIGRSDVAAVGCSSSSAVSRAESTPDDVAAIDGRPIGRSDVAAFGGAVAGAVSRAESTSDDLAAIDGRPIGRSDVAAVGCPGSGAVSRAESAPDFRAVARADRKPCAHDELATNRGTDDRTTEPHAVDRADTAPDASADDA